MLNLFKTDMWKDFCQSLRTRIVVDRRLGYRKKGELVVWYQSNGISWRYSEMLRTVMLSISIQKSGSTVGDTRMSL